MEVIQRMLIWLNRELYELDRLDLADAINQVKSRLRDVNPNHTTFQ